MKRNILMILVLFVSLYHQEQLKAQNQKNRPNVIVIMTDDQGYSHLSGQGHPDLETPNIDRFRDESVRFTNFHQELLCAPSRASLLTGRYSVRTGAWRTSAGRAIMRAEETTLAELFKDNGYKTAHFGKWHLGDNYPFRPEDQGFEEVVMHKSGGVGQIADFWGNDYFDDCYYHNSKLEKYKGYCADIWFGESMRFMKENKEKPFLIYLASNTPHSPYHIAENYVKPFTDKGIPKKRAQYYGMISNMDENMGRLLKFLEDEGLKENTIVVFTTDDGASAGAFDTHDGSVNGFPVNGFNAGLRGRKASVYEGGHRTFCFLRWPVAKYGKGKDIDVLSSVCDIFPSLADMCNIPVPDGLELDGLSLRPTINGEDTSAFKDRSLFVQLHGGVGLKSLKGAPHPYLESVILKNNWRLVNGEELYDLNQDPGQKNNIADKHPEVIKDLKQEYEKWYSSSTRDMHQACRIIVGSEKANPVELTGQDYYTSDSNSPVATRHAITLIRLNGPWKLHVAKKGTYSIKLSRYPLYTNCPIDRNASTNRQDVKLNRVRLRIGDRLLEKTADFSDTYIEFTLNLDEGDTDLQGWFIDENEVDYPTYFVNVEII
jgi:arylsulfatase A-like enzyme